MNKHKATNSRIARLVFIVFSILTIVVPQPVLAQESPFKVDFTDNDINYYDPRGNNACGGTTTGGDTLTRFLQALAKQESGGKIDAVSGTGAKGKYQYIDSTWRAHTAQYYPPASKYANALQAPEEYQDALAYIEYSAKFKQFNGDLFKLAISHFYPAANTNPSLLDILPPGNVVTPRQYAQQFIQKMNTGSGSEIPIKASQAPEFQTYLDKAGGQGGGGAAGGQVCSGGGVIAGDIVKTALNLAWPTQGHGKEKGDATPPPNGYQIAMPKYNGATSDDPWSDCGVFVATVMVATGADESYQRRETSSQIDYIKKHPEKFDLFTSSDYVFKSDKLLPGDIMIQDGHTYIFTGPYKGGDGKLYNSAAASLHDHVPEADNWYPGFYVARVKK
jgi:hypothetical protein